MNTHVIIQGVTKIVVVRRCIAVVNPNLKMTGLHRMVNTLFKLGQLANKMFFSLQSQDSIRNEDRRLSTGTI